MRGYISRAASSLLADETRQPWRERAACRGRPDLIRGGEGAEERRTFCFGCPVLDDCRAWALALPIGAETEEIAGGLTAYQRRSWRLRASHLTNQQGDPS